VVYLYVIIHGEYTIQVLTIFSNTYYVIQVHFLHFYVFLCFDHNSKIMCMQYVEFNYRGQDYDLK
jgi:hypothetical protein